MTSCDMDNPAARRKLTGNHQCLMEHKRHEMVPPGTSLSVEKRHGEAVPATTGVQQSLRVMILRGPEGAANPRRMEALPAKSPGRNT